MICFRRAISGCSLEERLEPVVFADIQEEVDGRGGDMQADGTAWMNSRSVCSGRGAWVAQ